MRLIDEIALSNDSLGNALVTDFYFVQGEVPGRSTYRVTETGTPTRIIGNEVVQRHYSYEVFILRQTGWVSILYVEQQHVADATTAAMAAHRILTAQEV